MVPAGRRDLVFVVGCRPGVADEGLAPRRVEAIDLDVNAGWDVLCVGLEDDLVELQAGLQAQPVEEGGDAHRWQGVDVGRGVAVDEQVEGLGFAADGGVVAGIAVSVVNVDGSELRTDGLEDLLKRYFAFRTRRSSQPSTPSSWSSKCSVSCAMGTPPMELW